MARSAVPKYRIRINGKYLKGYDETQTQGKTGHMGWQPRAFDMPMIVLTENADDARIIEGVIELRSQFERIADRVRYAGLELDNLEIVKVRDDQ